MKKTLICFMALFVLLSLAFYGCSHSAPTSPVTTAPDVAYSDLSAVPAGTFLQEDFSGNSFTATVSAFKIGKYQVTYALWYPVYQWAVTNGYTFANAGMEGNAGTAGAAPTAAKYQPVVGVNWRDAIVWCNAYSQISGLTSVYYSDSALTKPIKDSTNGAYGNSLNAAAGSFDEPYVNWSVNGYRLLTESEYKYAASYINGTNWTPYNWSSGATADCSNLSAIEAVAWFADNCSATQAVGGKNPNAIGLYDMTGNVNEWCWDWYGSYPASATVNYRGGTSSNMGRMLLGLSYTCSAPADMGVGFRGSDPPFDTLNDDGFRVAKSY
jgi:formylglycine-generating enzyme required for sulfatase activity